MGTPPKADNRRGRSSSALTKSLTVKKEISIIIN